jgi:hypothetical protein
MKDKPLQRVFKKDFIHIDLTQKQDKWAQNKTERVMIEQQEKVEKDPSFKPMERIDVYSGSLAEIAVADYLGVKVNDTKNYDIKIESYGITLDVKSKKVFKDNPYPNHHNEIYTINQETNYYIFCQVCIETMSVWILGYISKEEFLKYNDFVKRGDVKPNDTKVADKYMYCLQTMYLNPIKNIFSDIVRKKLKKTFIKYVR